MTDLKRQKMNLGTILRKLDDIDRVLPDLRNRWDTAFNSLSYLASRDTAAPEACNRFQDVDRLLVAALNEYNRLMVDFTAAAVQFAKDSVNAP